MASVGFMLSLSFSFLIISPVFSFSVHNSHFQTAPAWCQLLLLFHTQITKMLVPTSLSCLDHSPVLPLNFLQESQKNDLLQLENRLPFTPPFDFSNCSDDKESACNAGDPSSVPESERSPGEGNDYPLQYSAQKIPWTEEWTTVHEITQNWTQLSNFHFFFSFHHLALIPPFSLLFHTEWQDPKPLRYLKSPSLPWSVDPSWDQSPPFRK